jgi:hypothetical protein
MESIFQLRAAIHSCQQMECFILRFHPLDMPPIKLPVQIDGKAACPNNKIQLDIEFRFVLLLRGQEGPFGPS